MPRSKKTKRRLKRRSWDIDESNSWIIKNFLTQPEKMALISFYQDKLIKEPKQLTKDVEHRLRIFTERMKFIMDHF